MSRIIARGLSATAVALLAAAGLVAGAASASAAAYCGYAETGLVSADVPTIQCFPDLATSSPTISGKAMQGLTLQAVQGTTWVSPVGKGYPVGGLPLDHYQ